MQQAELEGQFEDTLMRELANNVAQWWQNMSGSRRIGNLKHEEVADRLPVTDPYAHLSDDAPRIYVEGLLLFQYVSPRPISTA